jgi:hypothetical protein
MTEDNNRPFAAATGMDRQKSGQSIPGTGAALTPGGMDG